MNATLESMFMAEANGAKAMVPLTAFTSKTTSKLTGLSVRQLHYWDKSGFFTPTFVDSVRRRPHNRLYSFQDVVGLRTIADLRKTGITLQELRKVREIFKPGVTDDWAKRRFYTVGRRVFFSHQDAIVASQPLGQQVEIDILEVAPITENVEVAIRKLQERGVNDVGRITRDRWVAGGVPVLAGTRIPTKTIAWFHDKGYDRASILANYPRLTDADIDAAIRYERRLAEQRERTGKLAG
jgi:uncharacterized protein (DUF433 family)/DNA-binding transcriptional MerR regulator